MMHHILLRAWNDAETLAPLVFAGALRGTAVLLCAVVAAVLARRSSAAVRHMVWMLGLASALAMPILSVALPSWRFLPPIISNQGTGAAAITAEFPAPIRETDQLPLTELAPEHVERSADAIGRAQARDTAALSISSTDLPSHHSIFASIALLWLGGATLASIPLMASCCVLFRLAKKVRAVDEPQWQSLLKELSVDLKLRRPPLLLKCDAPVMPMTWGVFRPRILLPVDHESWSIERRRVVLLHELAHVKRMDCLSGLMARAACAVYWFNPIAWIALIRMRDLRERACDDMALAAGSDAPNYAEHLLAIVASTCRPLSGGIAMARSSRISRRLEALLDGHRPRTQVTALRAILMIGASLAVAILLAMLRADEQRAAAPATSHQGASIEGDVTEVDGNPVAGADVEMILIRYVENVSDVKGVDIFARTKSDAGGHFQLPQPPASQTPRSDFIRATSPRRAWQYESLRRRNDRLVVYDWSRHAEIEHPSLILPPEAQISGVVVDQQGNPIAGAQVQHRSNDTVSTDVQGRFHFDKVSPSRYGVYWDFNSLIVTHPDYVKKQLRMDDVIAGRGNSVRLVLERGIVQRGTLSDADTGKPLSGFFVQADFEPRQETWFVANSDVRGRYELRVPKSRITLRPGVPLGTAAIDSNYYPVVDVREVLAADADALPDVNFTFHRARSISGKIAGADDMSALYLEARPADADPNWRANNRHGTTFAPDGTFRITQLKPGRYDLLVSQVRDARMQGTLLEQPVVVPEANDVTGVVLDLPQSAAANLEAELHGVVRYADGRPARGARLALLPEGDASLELNHDTYAAADGTFSLRGVDTHRKWTLWSRDSIGTQGAALLLTQPEQMAKLVELTLKSGAGFSGFVRDSSGKGLRNYEVTIADIRPDGRYTAHRPLVRTQTDDAGQYTITGFAPPAGVTGFILEALPDVLAERLLVPLQSEPYSDFEIQWGTIQTGYDFVVEQTASRMKIIPKRSSAPAREAK